MNKQIWEMYKTSNRGQEVIDLFTFYADEDIELFQNKLEKVLKKNCNEDEIDTLFTRIYLINDNLTVNETAIGENEFPKDFYMRFIEDFEVLLIEEDKEGNLIKSTKASDVFIKKEDYRSICAIIDSISINLYVLFPQFFFPILYNERFDILIKNCDALGIDLPNIPKSVDKKKRVMYYYDLCEVLYNFSIKHEMSAEEVCACVYDFATILQESNEVSEDLPEPTNVWFTGADKRDYQTTLQNLSPDSVNVWACNEQTKRGDIIVIYCLSPKSFIHSIWRANSDGVANPFNYYYSRATVTKPIQIPPITYSELKTDEYWSNVPIVRKNLQGINGIQLTAKDYAELLRLISSKNFDINTLPSLYSPKIEIEGNLSNEKDVEEKLVIPLLLELGYSPDDWVRQLSQKAGRNLKAIPDFVFFPKGEKHFQNSPFVLETKFLMNSANEKMNSFNQALSYCKMMSSELLGLCDKDRIIIFKKKNGVFDRFNPVFEKHWGNLRSPETFAMLKKIIGKEIVKNI